MDWEAERLDQVVYMDARSDLSRLLQAYWNGIACTAYLVLTFCVHNCGLPYSCLCNNVTYIGFVHYLALQHPCFPALAYPYT